MARFLEHGEVAECALRTARPVDEVTKEVAEEAAVVVVIVEAGVAGSGWALMAMEREAMAMEREVEEKEAVLPAVWVQARVAALDI